MSGPPKGLLPLLGNRSGPAFFLALRLAIVVPCMLPTRRRASPPPEPLYVDA